MLRRVLARSPLATSLYRTFVTEGLQRVARDLRTLPRRVRFRNDKRVFGIGLSKTGTSSLSLALERLGYECNDFPIEMLRLRKDSLSFRVSEAAAYQALVDIPVSAFFRELDEAYPGSKFVLTIRDQDGWLRSCARHFLEGRSWGRKIDLLNERVYGSTSFDPVRFEDAYARHVRAVKEHFSDRPNDLLVLDIVGGEGWAELCPFLGIEIPPDPFPWANRTEDRRSSSGTNDRSRF